MVASAEEKPPAPTAPRKEAHKETRELQVGFLYPHHTLVCCDIGAVSVNIGSEGVMSNESPSPPGTGERSE